MKIKYLAGAIASLIVVSTLSIGCKQVKQEAGQSMGPQKLVVSGVVMTPRVMVNSINATGSILANEEVDIRSEITGRVRAILFKEGSSVSKGQLLVKIDDSELQADLKKLELEEKLAKDDVFRKGKLREIEAISQEEYDVSVNNLGIIQAEMDLVRSKIAKTELRAPFSGMIGLRFVSEGAYINSNTLISRLQDVNQVKVEFSIPEKYANLVRQGTSISFSVDGVDSTFSGRVYAVETNIDPNTRTIALRALCPNTKRLLIPGSFAQVSITLETIPDALSVPSEAIIPDLQGERLFITSGGLAHMVYVKTGIRTEREVQILEGINAGDTVITSGLMQIRESSEVIIK